MSTTHIIASAAVVAEIESNAPRVRLTEPGRWYDTRPMVDQREHCPEVIDMHELHLQWALDNGLAHRHLTQPHLVRINPEAAA